eukprot:5404341-Prymnesium_polylepis.1
MPMRCCKPEQPPRLHIVLRPTAPICVHDTEVVLRLSVTLRRCKPEQPPRLHMGMGKALAAMTYGPNVKTETIIVVLNNIMGTIVKPICVHEAEVVLRLSVTLRRCKPEQPPRLHLVLRPAKPLHVHEAEGAMRLSEPLRHCKPE